MTTRIYISFISFLIISTYCSCKKWISEVEPPINQVSNNNVFSSDATATSTIVGMYSQMMNNPFQFSAGSTTIFAGMSADELRYYLPGSYQDEFLKNDIQSDAHGFILSNFWQPCYKYIYSANLAIEGLNNSTSLTATVKSRLIGEAKLVRAVCYFYLVNIFGEVPLIIASDYRPNVSLPRTSVNLVYKQMVQDLKDAENLLPATYPSAERTRPNKWTATSLLSRVYLYLQDWTNAESSANAVINSGNYSLTSDLNKVFLKTSNEAIWQLQPVNATVNTWEGNLILPASPTSPAGYLLSDTLLNSFETGDQRKIAWVGSQVYAGQTVFYPWKYKVYGNNAPVTEYNIVLRLAEQYLIRAEARARQNNLSGTINDINIIRSRAGLNNVSTSLSQLQAFDAITQERKIEFFAEWGQRWFDLKRTNKASNILASQKGSTWQATDVLWPIPQPEISANPTLTQNPGY